MDEGRLRAAFLFPALDKHAQCFND